MKWKGKIDFEKMPELNGDGLITESSVNTISGTLNSKIDSEIATISGALDEHIEDFTLDGTDISNKYITVSNPPRNAQVFVEGGLKGVEDADYTITTNQINWNGYDWDGLLEAGDILSVLYWS